MTAKGAARPTCGSCGFAVPATVDRCVKCGADVGYPNVRAASLEQEAAALEDRVKRAFVSAEASGSTANLHSFEAYAARSQAVIVRSIAQLDTFVHADNVMLATYHAAVQASYRLPEDNEWDPRRVSVDAAINAGFHDKVHYAVLSGNGLGVTSYGGYHVLLRESDIQLRSSVFEENGFAFLERQKGNRVPPGHRAPWQTRGRLAVAKLHARVRVDTPASSFGGILLDQGTAHGTSDFIEVHVYGSIHRQAIVSVEGPVPNDEIDKFLWKKIKRSLSAVGATLKEV